VIEPTSRRGPGVLLERADATKRAFNRADALVSLAQGLSCDAGVIKVVEGEHGTPLSVGRKRRTSRVRSSVRCTSATRLHIPRMHTPDLPGRSPHQALGRQG
jgi:hypothetical protein